MKIEENLIYNLEELVCLPNYDRDYYEAFEYSFKNIYYIKNNLEDSKKIIEIINKNEIKQVILVDFLFEYINIIRDIKNNVEIKFIFTRSLATLSNEETMKIFYNIIDLRNKNVFRDLGVLDENLYIALKEKNDNVYNIKLDIPIEKMDESNRKGIGLLNDNDDVNHSFFNELSACTLIEKKEKVNLYNPSYETLNFVKEFNLEYKILENKEKFYSDVELNLYVNFTNTNNIKFLKSMDNEIPCILGNNFILKNNTKLKEALTVKSDDDIDEIADKVNKVLKSKGEILKEYEQFRKIYSTESIESIQKFLQLNIKKENNEKYLKILSVIVPVYNTEKYIEECLNSIEKAKIENMEIIIINDGSTDKSDEVINEYIEKHKELEIKYIKQENHGLGNVRNVGINNAKGKYIASIDSDDTINSEYFKEALKYMNKDIDIIMCDWLSVYNSGEKYQTSAKDYIFDNIEDFKGIMFTTIMPSTCNKIIKKSLFDELKYKYVEGLKYEDLSLNPLILLKAKTIKYINKQFYEYKIRDNSIMRTSAGTDMIKVIKMLNDRIDEAFDDKNLLIDLDEVKFYTYFWRTEEFIFNQLYDLKNEERKKFIEEINTQLLDILKELYNNKYYIKRINELEKDWQKYLEERKNALFENKLDKYIEGLINNNKCKKLTPPLIFYGRE